MTSKLPTFKNELLSRMPVISLTVNGQNLDVEALPHRPLVEVLREAGLKGTKLGCASGECGACTVLVDGKAVCACLLPIGRVVNRVVETIEGVGTVEKPHPLQTALHQNGAFQCGFCTPGVVMSLLGLLRETRRPHLDEVKAALQGNVCRCSGYKKLHETIQAYIEAQS